MRANREGLQAHWVGAVEGLFSADLNVWPLHSAAGITSSIFWDIKLTRRP